MKNVFANVVRSLRVPNVAEREMAYLAASHDHNDLEYRQMQIDRGMFRARRNGSWL